MRNIINVLIVLFVASISTAYTVYDVEPRGEYASRGLSVINHPPRARAMGYSGVALADSINSTTLNPSTLDYSTYTKYTVLYTPEFSILKDEISANTLNRFDSYFPNVSMQVKMGRYGSVGVGLNNTSFLNYDVEYTNTMANTNDSTDIKRSAMGSSNVLYLAYSKVMNKNLALGLSYERYNEKGRYNYKELDSPLGTTISHIVTKRVVDNFLSAGLTAKFKKLSVGVSYKMPFTSIVSSDSLNTEYKDLEFYHGVSGSDSIFSDINYKTTTNLPTEIHIGLGLKVNRNLTLASDAHMIFWDKVGYDNKELLVGAGLEYIWSEKLKRKNYFYNIPLRLGGYFHQDGKNSFIEKSITTGISLPTRFNWAMFNVSYEYILRSDEAYTNYSEDVHRISVEFIHKNRWGKVKNKPSEPSILGGSIIANPDN